MIGPCAQSAKQQPLLASSCSASSVSADSRQRLTATAHCSKSAAHLTHHQQSHGRARRHASLQVAETSCGEQTCRRSAQAARVEGEQQNDDDVRLKTMHWPIGAANTYSSTAHTVSCDCQHTGSRHGPGQACAFVCRWPAAGVASQMLQKQRSLHLSHQGIRASEVKVGFKKVLQA